MEPTSQHDRIEKGDRGDGTRVGKEQAKRRYAHRNAGHIIDMYDTRTNYEVKCYNDHATDWSLGNGTHDGGAKPRTVDGHIFAFGKQEETLIYQIRGAKGRGTRGTAFNRANGEGFVAPAVGDYAD